MNDTQIPSKRSALVLIDLQRGIVGMKLAPRDGLAVVEASRRLVDRFHQVGGLVVFVRVETSNEGTDALSPLTDAPPASPVRRPDDWSQLVIEPSKEAGDIVIVKRQWGAFYGTELDLQLRRRSIQTIVLAGISTNIGVESTARDAYERGYDQVFVEDAMSSTSEEAHRMSVTNVFPRMGRVRTCDNLINMVKNNA
ncbi:hydrolase [Rhodococcus sp. SRB_17]|nr:hydrolase [Rhodococcus sp. SRB_17]